ncbi:MAG: YggS family pyridoxal phosphate-dependent enzyme [Crocinitomicaceae bacterium]|nr:YggS family pyridoxal phosphate-dependent enzyme [Crocinitomicaceae bacterium]MDG1777385.1 YggS family pyridoxal phosphate-dependent enzyme [Crocinitomicaceae bacterium]
MITSQLAAVQNSIPENVTLVAVSKTKPIAMLQEAYDLGQRVFGENKVQELVEKQEVLPKDIKWHFIGHLQSNKVKYIAPFVTLIHAVDSLKLLKEINKQALKNNRTINCLLQFHIAEEDSKFGLTLESAKELLETEAFSEMRNVSIVGLMGMASFTKDEEQVREEFRTLENYFHVIQSHFFKFNPSFEHLSIGMSNDYKIAIEEGSTMVRVGSSIFGSR